uniref:Uncharacterized protein n=1 Tax=Anguilla anguilla TaxID=7936 RepID=A0A0E9QCI9_ANGAN
MKLYSVHSSFCSSPQSKVKNKYSVLYSVHLNRTGRAFLGFGIDVRCYKLAPITQTPTTGWVLTVPLFRL